MQFHQGDEQPSLLTVFNPCIFCLFLRFGGLQSSQRPVVSKACDKASASATETSDRAADSDSEEEPNDDLDPFSSQGQAEPAKGEICSSVMHGCLVCN